MTKKKAPAKSEKGTVTRALEAQKGWEFTEKDITKIIGSDELMEAWEKLRAFAAGLGKQRIYASAQSIMFARKVCYFYARPKKNFIEVFIFLPHRIAELPYTVTAGKKERFCSKFKLEHSDQVEEPLTDWLQEAFDLAPAE